MLEIRGTNWRDVSRDLQAELRVDSTGYHRDVSQYLVFSTRQAVSREQDVNGRKFAALAPSTANARRGTTRRGTAHILQDNGSMVRALVGQFSPSEARLTLGDRRNAQKAIWHQQGTSKMPQREWIGLRSYAGHDDFLAIEQIAERHIGR